MIMTYEELIKTIEKARRFDRMPGVEVSGIVLDKLGICLDNLKIIHIAGTNGKGSVAAMLTQILISAGYRVGRFTSPHLIEFTERIAVNGQSISNDDTLRIGEKLLHGDFGVTLTFFDYSFLIAMQYFIEQNCDIIVLETGLGGRLDSTNVVKYPLCSVITRIGLDHMKILGDNLTDIAKEKAGIIKPGRPVVIGMQKEEVYQVLLQQTKQKQCRMYSSQDLEVESLGLNNSNMQEFIYAGKRFELALYGFYQVENAYTVLETIHCLQDEGFCIDEDAVRQGLREVVWPGRMQIISRYPYLLLDGAHNPDGVRALSETLTKWMRRERFTFVMGVMGDKDYMEMVRILAPIADRFVTITLMEERAKKAEELAAEIREEGIDAIAVSSLEEAIGMQKVDEKWVLIGSLYFAGEVLGDI
ncbi:bifunctional folylpolyglutamate synthase/dihydrofolate synthase [Eubacterium oxidoreducens]|uniref:tetrahydrofolate synthase n=1 Tax=Eubacterium oxidoreducens TaxID=1732 RepID=A0A1G6BHW5_EUBOX|nr:folylpolyglutamate synthase/dihydrofolate synthase family protein [Eubacterium oxidoreducens]SDB20235.1 dihydrofolate synthase / folylpolyglutamate synthase [Eubacterium oxidoreducens]